MITMAVALGASGAEPIALIAAYSEKPSQIATVNAAGSVARNATQTRAMAIEIPVCSRIGPSLAASIARPRSRRGLGTWGAMSESAASETPRDAIERSDRAGLLAVAVASVVWGMGGVLVKSSTLTGLRFAMFRLWIGVAIYAVVLLAVRRPVRWSTLRACVPGGVIFGVDISLAFLAFKGTTITNASIIGALTSIAIVLASAPLLGERIGRRELALAAASFLGVAMVAVGSSGAPTWSPSGDLFALAGIVSWTLYWFFSRRARATTGALEYMACVMLTAAVVVTPVAVALGGTWHAPTSTDWLSLVAVALFPGFVGHTLVAWSHRHVASWLSALITQCSPVVASAAAWVFLEERITALTAAGGAVVLGATCLVIWDERRRAPMGLEVAERPA